MLDPLVDQLRLRQSTRIVLQMRGVIFKDKLVDIDLADSNRDATLSDRIRKPVSTM